MDERTTPHKWKSSLPKRCLGQSEFYRMLKEATWKQHMIGLECEDFL